MMLLFFLDISASVIKDTLTASGGIASVAAFRLIQWPDKVPDGGSHLC